MAKQHHGNWQTISLHPLSGILDLRSRPAEIPAGGFRYKLNWSVSTEGKLCRAPGFQKFYADSTFDEFGIPSTDPSHRDGFFYHNHDHHHQGSSREIITFGYESTASDGTRRLFDGTQSRVSYLNELNGYWTDIITGKGAARTRWQAAELQDKLFLTNNFDFVQYHTLGTGTAQPVDYLKNITLMTAAKVIVEFQGFILLMNTVEGGKRFLSRIRWSDLNDGTIWGTTGHTDSIAGFQDLDYGDEILAAAPLLGGLYVFTRRAIWRLAVTGIGDPSSTQAFSFQRVYYEPKNQTGCLVYPNTLVSTGTNLYYLGRDALYHYNPYLAEPSRGDPKLGDDFTHKLDGAIFVKTDTRINPTDCDAPVAEYRPADKTYIVSWANAIGNGHISVNGSNQVVTINNWTMEFQLEQQTGGLFDVGWTMLVNYRRTPVPTLCNETQYLLGASNRDWCWKEIGVNFSREYANLKSPPNIVAPDTTIDLDLNVNLATDPYLLEGYYSILRGMIPTGLFDREKIVRNVELDHDTTEQSEPCVIRLRIGNSQNLVDVNDLDDTCAPQWRQMQDRPLSCPDQMKISQMTAANIKPGISTEWDVYELNEFLYFELIIANADGSPALGGDTCWQRIDFDVKARSKY